MTDASPAFVAVAGLYDARSRAGTRMLAGHTDATHSGLWGGKVQVYAFPTDDAAHPYTLYAKTKARPDLTFACRLELRHSNSGTPILFGTWGGVRVYVFPQTAERHSKDCLPDYELCIRIEDWSAKHDGPPTKHEPTLAETGHEE